MRADEPRARVPRALVAARRAAIRACARRSPGLDRYIATPRTREAPALRLARRRDARRISAARRHRPRRRLHLRRPALARPRALGARHGHAAPRGRVRLPLHAHDHASRPSRSRDPTDEQRERVGEAARRLVELRDGWLNPPGLDPADLEKRTLTNLYNQRPTWLANAHADLDAAVLAAYGWPADLPDDEILERLLALNLERETAPGEGAQSRQAVQRERSE